VNIFTIGYTKKTARRFFELLSDSGARRIVDVRLNNVSQLAGFTKKADLAYFADAICGIDYVHLPVLAPTQNILDRFKKDGGDWSTYEHAFFELMKCRHIEDIVSREELDGACLLCSEDTPHHCHRRLIAEYLKQQWGDVEIIHLT